jgi:hypothetical protein
MTASTTPSGAKLRDAALDLLRERRAELVKQLKMAALRVAIDRGEVTADCVRPMVAIPPDVNPKVAGCVFADLRDAGILRRDGFRNSTRPEAHARELKVWALADRPAALALLAALKQQTTTARPTAAGQSELPFID